MESRQWLACEGPKVVGPTLNRLQSWCGWCLVPEEKEEGGKLGWRADGVLCLLLVLNPAHHRNLLPLPSFSPSPVQSTRKTLSE